MGREEEKADNTKEKKKVKVTRDRRGRKWGESSCGKDEQGQTEGGADGVGGVRPGLSVSEGQAGLISRRAPSAGLG